MTLQLTQCNNINIEKTAKYISSTSSMWRSICDMSAGRGLSNHQLAMVLTNEGHTVHFLLRDTMLAQYMLSSCVRLSLPPPVRYKPVLYQKG